eukprot:gene8838-biopygen11880
MGVGTAAGRVTAQRPCVLQTAARLRDDRAKAEGVSATLPPPGASATLLVLFQPSHRADRIAAPCIGCQMGPEPLEGVAAGPDI